MSRGVSIALVICGSCLASIIPLRSMLLDWSVIRTIAAGGELHASFETLPIGYAWAMFVLGALMILFGAWMACGPRGARQ